MVEAPLRIQARPLGIRAFILAGGSGMWESEVYSELVGRCVFQGLLVSHAHESEFHFYFNVGIHVSISRERQFGGYSGVMK